MAVQSVPDRPVAALVCPSVDVAVLRLSVITPCLFLVRLDVTVVVNGLMNIGYVLKRSPSHVEVLRIVVAVLIDVLIGSGLFLFLFFDSVFVIVVKSSVLGLGLADSTRRISISSSVSSPLPVLSISIASSNTPRYSHMS